MFFFKKKKIIVDCFTDEPGAFTFHPIAKATEFLPEWWKQLPSYYDSLEAPGVMIKQTTIKRCDGFTQMYQKGYVLPLWASMQIHTSETSYNYAFSKPLINKNVPLVEYHSDKQYGNTFADRLHMKITSPWYLKQNNSCEFTMQPMIWSTENHWTDFTVLPGVVDFKNQHWTHINMFLQKNRSKILIEAGTPLYHIIPLTEDTVVFKNHLVDTSEINKMYNTRFGSFTDSYKNIKRHFKEKSSKCPVSR